VPVIHNRLNPSCLDLTDAATAHIHTEALAQLCGAQRRNCWYGNAGPQRKGGSYCPLYSAVVGRVTAVSCTTQEASAVCAVQLPSNMQPAAGAGGVAVPGKGGVPGLALGRQLEQLVGSEMLQALAQQLGQSLLG
jgi:hypothetical protein